MVCIYCATVRRQHRLPTSGPTLVSFIVTPSTTVRDLGVHIDSDLSMRSHVRRTVSRCFAVVRQLRTIRRQIPSAVFQSLIVAVVLSRLDYCRRSSKPHPASPVCSERCCTAYFPDPTLRAHHCLTHPRHSCSPVHIRTLLFDLHTMLFLHPLWT